MSAVVDSSVIVAALVDTGPVGIWAEEVIDDQAPYAPALVCTEAENVLRQLEVAKPITSAEGSGAQEDLVQLEIELFPFGSFFDHIW